MDKKGAKRYRTYLLRCWREGEPIPGFHGEWRFHLCEILAERRQYGFSSFEEVATFLYADLEQSPGENEV